MDAVETAIRNALERGDANDPAYREKVYGSAFAVLERSIAARPDLSPDAADRRRDHLKGKIRNIETEFTPARPPAPEAEGSPAEPPPPPPQEPAGPAPRERESREPSFPTQPLRPSAPTPTSESDLGPLLTEEDLALDDAFMSIEPQPAAGPELEPAGERRDYPPAGRRHDYGHGRRGRRMLPLVLGIIVAVAVVAALWWLVSGLGVLGVSQLKPEPAAPAPAAVGQTGVEAEDENWIIVFTPSDPTRVIATDGARAEIVTHGGDSFLKISSPGADQPVSFQVGQGILEKLAGHEAVFDIVARAEDGQKTQISVSCDLGNLGDCGRSRFEVSGTISDFLVRAQLGDGSPSGGGTISIVPDVTGSGKALEILRIRASAAGT